ncbi:MAG: hypothetical protein JNM10_04370 [Planctomycetia bacterium]|nr:hypothetical protein [Planctomycetia bacterium]
MPGPLPLPDARVPGERIAAALVFVVFLAARVAYAGRLRVDSDELQHLHLAWGWSVGLVQYRDLFDNHLPAFHLLLAPLLRATGETPAIVEIARLAMLPLFVATAFATWRLGRRVASPRVAAWGTLLGVGTFEFYARSVEARADDLWALAWIAGLAVAVGGPFTRGRALATGAWFGFACLASVKSALLLVTFAAGAVGLGCVAPTVRAAWPARRALAAAGWMALPALLLVGALAAWMASLGALAPLVRGVFLHAVVPGAGDPARTAVAVAALLAGTAGLLAAARAVVARSAPDVGPRRALLLLACGLFVLLLETVWITSARQDKLPVVPVLGVLLATGVDALVRRRGAARGDAPAKVARVAVGVLAGVVAFAFGRTVHNRRPWVDETAGVRAYLAEVLAVTRPGETVLDPKGQSVFRRRPTYLVYERFTRERVARGVDVDPAARDLVAHGTWCCSPGTSKYGDATAAFLLAHTFRAGRLRIAGARAGPLDAGASLEVRIGVPGVYTVVREDGAPFAGTVDGEPFAGPRPWAAGPHVLRTGPGPATRVAVVPAAYVERGGTPFVEAPLDLSFTGW